MPNVSNNNKNAINNLNVDATISNKKIELADNNIKELVASLSPEQREVMFEELQKAESMEARKKAEGWWVQNKPSL